jgi:RNA polymerase-interacting CarD/CdnL/TRCF family regulator
VKQFVEGEKRPFYEIAFPGSTLWVPLDLANGAAAVFLQTALDVLYQEWAVVEGITPAEATSEIVSLLKKGREAHDH